MTSFDDYTDVDFEAHNHGSGCSPEESRHQCMFDSAVADGIIQLVDRSRWPGLIADSHGVENARFCGRVKSQGPHGTCASQASSLAFQFAVQNQFDGLDVEFSAISLYHQLTRNCNAGSVIADNMKALQATGILPVDSPTNKRLMRAVGLNDAHTLPNSACGMAYPRQWRETARHFRILEAYRLRTYDELVSALLRGWVCVYGRRGHAIMATDPVLSGSRLANVVYQNSWGAWGVSFAGREHGFGLDTESVIASAIGDYGAFCIRVARSSILEAMAKVEQ